ncbi:MAG: CotH kinase family protein [Gemmatimonadaceae bacterium]|nr:CotH kinase family protein [Gemmatimonadaceae bacterium]
MIPTRPAWVAPFGAKADHGTCPLPFLAPILALVSVTVLFQSPVLASEEQLELPVYHLEIDPQDLDALHQSPREGTRFPARFSFAGQGQACEVRFRGATARKYRKKSWKVWFENRRNPLGVRELNLNAEYTDLSLMRNALAMMLFRSLGHPAPAVRHISLMVNNMFMGVFVQVEEPGEGFLERYHLQPGSLFKSENNAGSTAPLLDFNHYAAAWNKKVGIESDYTALQRLFNQIFYLSHEDLQARLPQIVNVEGVLHYFAVACAISSFDSVIKNTLLCFNPGGRLEQILPWDHDASFGNHWTGEYRPDFETTYLIYSFRHNLLFQRLMEYETFRQAFWKMVHEVAGRGFESVEAQIDSTYGLIRSDVYLDDFKSGTNEEFDREISRLKGFLSARRSFLTNSTFFEKEPLSNLYCSTPFPVTKEDDRGVIFRAASPVPQSVAVEYTTDLTSYSWGEAMEVRKLPLFDDGQHDDLQAGDLVYGNRLLLPANFRGLVPYAFRAGAYSYPPNGLYYVNYNATKTFALNASGASRKEYEQLRIGEVHEMRNEYFVEIANTGGSELNLAYCSFQCGEYFNRFMFPPGTRLAAGDTLVLSSKRDVARNLFPRTPVLGDLFFEISSGDTLRLLDPALETLTFRADWAYSRIPLPSPEVVINEINYHSSDGRDTGDWVELYHAGHNPADLSGWLFRDGNDQHSFVLPERTLVEPGGFLVLCQDRGALQFLSQVACVGDFDFGLRNSGELIRLYDRHGLLVDSVLYGDGPPWPEEADGDGPTLELRHYDLDNEDPASWMGSLEAGGTPGAVNSAYTRRGTGDPWVPFVLSESTPNPFSSTVGFDLDLGRTAWATLKVYNTLGQYEGVLVDAALPAGRSRFTWTPGERGAGIYLFALEVDGRLAAVRKAAYLRE